MAIGLNMKDKVKSGMMRELGVVFNEVVGSVPQIALNCQPFNLSHSTYCHSKNQEAKIS